MVPRFPATLLGLALTALVLAPVRAARPATAAEGDPARSPAASLQREFQAQRPRLEASPYGRALALDSREYPNHLEGDAFALFDHPFARVQRELAPAPHWCDVLLLPPNTKHCQVDGEAGERRLVLFVGRDNDTRVEDAYRLSFSYAVAARAPDYLRLVLRSREGPLGTRDYRIQLEATPAGDGRTFVKLAYSYGYGTLSRVAMKAYLATFGAGKVGFTPAGRGPDGGKRLVRGMRGVMERNTMRYVLAIDAHLDSLAAPARERVARRTADWYAAIARYPLQLRDIERDDYLDMKRREFARMHAGDCCRVASGPTRVPRTASSSP